MTALDWENIFEYYKNTRDEIKVVEITESARKDTDSSMNSDISDNKAPETLQSTIAQKAIGKQEIKYGEFTVILFPSKGDVVIKNSEEYSIRIRKGKFPLEADFYLSNERMLLTEDDSVTPFVVNCFDDHIALKIYEGDVFTGISVSMMFNQ